MRLLEGTQYLVPNAVLEVQPDRAGLDGQPSGLAWVAVAALQIGGHRKLDRAAMRLTSCSISSRGIASPSG